VTSRLLLVGVSHRQAPAELRERLAVAAEGLSGVRPELLGARELVVLSTCNRLELYVAADGDARPRILSELAERAGVPDAALAVTAATLVDDEVVRHLCRVAAGLDSPLLGEPEILGQVRAAAAAASAWGSCGALLDRVFACAVRAGRRARSETGLAASARSLADVSVEVATQELGALAGRPVLVVGTGAMARLAAERFRAAGCDLVVAGRAVERAAALADRVDGRAAGLDALDAELAGAAVVVCCTRSPGLVVTAEQLAAAARAGADEPLLVLDLALPRDVDPAVATLAGCRLHDLDALQRRAAEDRVSASVDEVAAEAIAHEEAERFCAWRRSRAAVTTIASLRGRAEAIRTTELARVGSKLAELSPEQRQAVETMTAQLVNKLLHEPTVRIKQAAGGELVPALRELFALEDAA
jgi:glutamyl-tRNA reductase